MLKASKALSGQCECGGKWSLKDSWREGQKSWLERLYTGHIASWQGCQPVSEGGADAETEKPSVRPGLGEGMEVQIIRASKTAKDEGASTTEQRKKVAAYCRVSTDQEEQESSYEAQCIHYETLIRKNTGWVLAGIYADEGTTGTNTKQRTRFRQMIADCEAGPIDLIITKSISRFARNTLDCLHYVRKLKELGIAVFFEKENINTLDEKGEVLMTIMAALAQQESQSTSQNVRMGIQYRFQRGIPKLNDSQFLGLKLVTGGGSTQIVIVPEGAVIVRRIFREYLEGRSPSMIARRLEADHVLTGAGRSKWYQSTVQSILENEKYMGDLLLQKYFTESVLTHRLVKNRGQFPQYFIQDNHPPIIPRDIFYRTQCEKLRRSLLRGDPARIRYGRADALEGRLICGKCGRALKLYDSEEVSLREWRCRQRRGVVTAGDVPVQLSSFSNPRCDCRCVNDREIRDILLEAFNTLARMRREIEERRQELSRELEETRDSFLEEVEDREETVLEVAAEVASATAEGKMKYAEAGPQAEAGKMVAEAGLWAEAGETDTEAGPQAETEKMVAEAEKTEAEAGETDAEGPQIEAGLRAEAGETEGKAGLRADAVTGAGAETGETERVVAQAGLPPEDIGVGVQAVLPGCEPEGYIEQYDITNDRRHALIAGNFDVLTEKQKSEAAAWAELAMQEMQLRIMLEIIDGMKTDGRTAGRSAEDSGTEQAGRTPENNTAGDVPQGAAMAAAEEGAAEESPEDAVCDEAEDFFERTRFVLPREILDEQGHMSVFNDEIIIRCLDRILVKEDEYVISFKGGIQITAKG